MMYRVYFLITLLTSFVAAQDAIWAKWGHWTPCDKPCDYGYKRRYRGCVPSSKMICSDTDVELCTTGILCSHMSSQGVTPPDNEFEPEWLQWENWSSCSVTCGGGMRKRIKRCRAESDTTCMYTAAESCNEHSCNNEGRFDPGTLTWEPWSTCTVTCGGGLRRRARDCHDGICMESEEELCNEESCRFSNSGFTNSDHDTLPWEPWSTCTVSCGGGFRRRARDCHDGICMEIEEELCNEESCRFSNSKFTNSDRGILSWEPWSTCTVSCGGGFRRRARDCHDGICMESEEELCNEESCRFSNSEFTNSDLGILSWEPWSTCTVSCGGGLRIRGRDCHDGICMESEEESCNEESCRFSNSGFPNSDHGTLSWEPWSTCTVSCGGGLRIRRRDCHDGICMESEEELCNEESCRFSNSGFTNSDLDILSWEPWSTCTVSCGGGTRKRVKRCPDGSCMESEGQSCNQITCEPRNAENSRAKWSSWNNWLSCSTQCGSGKQIRNRYCMGFESCIGEAREERTCFERAGCTPVTTPKPIYSNWSAWSKCSKTCGKGLEVRSRICMERQIQCNKETSQTRQCTRRICPTPVWSNWGSWSTCSTFCGEGRQSRKRTCISGLCAGQPIQNSSCKIRNCVESKWSKWSHWSQCSKTCDRGTIERTRSCIEGDRGLLCEGKFMETEFCLIMNCPVKEPEWSKWSIWSKCSKTCGRGIIERSRSCSKGDHGSTCKGKNKETESCLIMNCPVKEPEWNKWGDWSKCSKTCDGGTRERSRSCNKVTTATSCKGKSKEIEQCLLNKCSVKAAVWSEWETWNECSVTCGNGKRERVRYCKNGSVRSSCKGESNEIETCKLKNCVAEHLSTWNSWTSCYPANPCGLPGWKVRTRTCIGGKMGVGNCKGMQKDYKQCVNPCNQDWGDWESWSKCSTSCDTGIMSRTRLCKSKKCPGNKFEAKNCTLRNCPLDKWSGWGSWAPCSPKCGLGTKTRNRTCTGSGCFGSPTETQKCIGINCKMPAGRNVGTWMTWESWTECSATCGNGTKTRKRLCNTEKCEGLHSESQKCMEEKCPDKWSEWGSWAPCSPRCGLGTKTRNRTCTGSDCIGSSTETQKCIGINCEMPAGRNVETKSTKCQEVQNINNGDITIVKEQEGIKLSFECDGGFNLEGPSEITCDSNGQWSNRPPFCIANTCFKNMERIEKGRTCRKSCKDAKECLGISNDCICDDVCGKSCFNPENVICNPPEKPENGNVQFDSRGYWDYCHYSCLPGFVLSGSTQRRCRSDGKWSGSTPKCMRFETCGQAGNVGSIFNEGIVGARVLAGTASMTGAWPWQAMITVNAENDVRKSLQSLKGGGSIINDQWILTAAHIFDPMLLKSKPNAKGDLIILGMTAMDISFTLPDHARIFEPELLMIHPRYRHSMKNFDNDVSLIKLGKQFKVVQQKFMYSTALPFGKITFSNHIRAVCLPCSQQRPTSLVQGVRKSFKNDLCGQVDSYKESDKVVVTGFGRLGERSQRPRILQQGLLKVAGNSICRKAVKNINKQWQEAVFTPRMLCAVSGRKVASVDACTGDSGGPLVRKVTTRNGTDFWVQEGIVSWGFGCGRVDDEGRLYPGFYTKLKSVLPFIQNTMEDNETGN